MITKSDLDQVEKFADRLFAKVGIDVEFTRHFMDRVNDARNKKDITPSELTRLFKQSYSKYGKKIAQLGPDAEAVINDMKTNINVPFVLNLKGNELELVAKTVMRKKDFKTSGPKLSFEQFITEDKGGKNLHLEHLEDEILNYGVDGGRAALNFLRSLRDMLAGASRSSVSMTVKWDGSPAIFAGIDPDDGKFFVAKKSVFNVNPKLYKTAQEIDDDLSGNLNSKFKVALAEFSKLGIKGVLQGDLMWTDDTETTKIDGVSYITFQPNTIVYAVPVDSEMGKKVKASKIGIVWHTTYTGSTLQGMKASFGADIKGLKKPSSVWMDDATYKDASGTATFTSAETESITAILSQVGKTFNKINANGLRAFLVVQNGMTGAIAGASLKTYNNSKVRAGEKIINPDAHAKGYEKWVFDSIQRQIDAAKSDAGKKKYTDMQKEYLREIKKHTQNLTQVIAFQNLLVDAKMQIVKKLNSVKGLTDTFIKTSNGFKVTNPEGYVAIDRISGGAVKLVDRMEFSFNNFTAVKNWMN
jgi:hypothetical protein